MTSMTRSRFASSSLPASLASIALCLAAAAFVTLCGMRLVWWEWLILLVISAVGVLSHPSHLLLTAVMVPGSALIGLAALVVILWPGRVSRAERSLAAFVPMGVLANAFVCGAISQPATRYGGRVFWPVPQIATFLVSLQAWPRRRDMP